MWEAQLWAHPQGRIQPPLLPVRMVYILPHGSSCLCSSKSAARFDLDSGACRDGVDCFRGRSYSRSRTRSASPKGERAA